jgi:hypothetical protein
MPVAERDRKGEGRFQPAGFARFVIDLANRG